MSELSGSQRNEDDRRPITEQDERSNQNRIGVVLAVLPGALYSVRLEDGQTVRAGLSSEARRAIVRLLSGNRVVVRLSSVDPHRGRIIQKL